VVISEVFGEGVLVKRILLTGFEPWADWLRNPSGDIALALKGKRIANCEIISTVLPVAHGEDMAKVAPLIEAHRPSAVVSLGLHGSGAAIHVERVALNLKVIDDVDYPIVEGGDLAYWATLPTREMATEIREAGIRARLTYSAGTFLCNHIMYSVLQYVALHELPILAGFLHLPPTPDLVALREGTQAGMALGDIQKGVEAGLQAVAEKVNDLPV